MTGIVTVPTRAERERKPITPTPKSLVQNQTKTKYRGGVSSLYRCENMPVRLRRTSKMVLDSSSHALWTSSVEKRSTAARTVRAITIWTGADSPSTCGRQLAAAEGSRRAPLEEAWRSGLHMLT